MALAFVLFAAAMWFVVDAGMGLGILFFEVGDRNVGIDLGGSHALVAQNFLHGAYVGSVVEHDGGKGVAQNMGCAFSDRRN